MLFYVECGRWDLCVFQIYGDLVSVFPSRNRQKIRWTTSVASVAIGFLLILFVYVFSVLSNDFLYLRSIRFIVPYEIVKF